MVSNKYVSNIYKHKIILCNLGIEVDDQHQLGSKQRTYIIQVAPRILKSLQVDIGHL